MLRLRYMPLVSLILMLMASAGRSQQSQVTSTHHRRHHDNFANSVNWSKLKAGGGIRSLEPGSRSNVVTYDAQGHPSRVLELDAMGKASIATDYVYDSSGHVTKIVQHGGQNDTPRVRTFVYDSQGNVISATTPESGTTIYTRDGKGNISSKTDASGNTISYSRDDKNRLTGKQYSDRSPSVVYDYQLKDRTIHYYLNGSAGPLYERAYHYDDQGGVDQITQNYPSKEGSNTYTIGLNYDGKGRLAGVTYPDGRVIEQQWSSKGHIRSVGEGGALYFSGATYWPSGFLHTANLGNGVVIEKKYNDQGMLDFLFARKSDQTLLSKGYQYTKTGSIRSVSDALDPNGSLNYNYDLLDRVSRAVSGSGTFIQNFQYDAFGNRALHGDTTLLQKFDSNNRFDSSTGPAYDGIGEMTFDGTHRYTYNAEGLISSVDEGSIRYEYDAEGYRVQKIVNKQIHDYVWLEGLLLAERLPDGSWIDYIYANGQRVASVTTPIKSADGKATVSMTTYFVTDPMGTVRMTVSGKGSVTTKGNFAPFGTEISESSSIKSSAASISFSDEVHDEETGLDTYKYRSYNPRLGRWMSPDPSSLHYSSISNPQTFNLYSYVDNDPLKFLDVKGLHSTGNCTIESADEDPSGDDREDMPLDDGVGCGGGDSGDGGSGDGGSGDDGSGDSCSVDACVTAPPDDPIDPDPTSGDPGPVYLDPALGTGEPSTTTPQSASFLTDKNGNIIYGANGQPALIPDGFNINTVLKTAETDKELRANAPMVGTAQTTQDLANFGRGGKWDLQRLSGNFDSRFIDSATILIGMFAQAAGITRDQILSIENAVAITSTYAQGTQMDSTYTYLPVRNVTNTDIGMNQISSGAIPLP